VDVVFRSNRLRDCAEDQTVAMREWGVVVGTRYYHRVRTLLDMATFEGLFDLHSLRLHPLTGGRRSEYAITLSGRWRLIITRAGNTITVEEVSNHYDD